MRKKLSRRLLSPPQWRNTLDLGGVGVGVLPYCIYFFGFVFSAICWLCNSNHTEVTEEVNLSAAIWGGLGQCGIDGCETDLWWHRLKRLFCSWYSSLCSVPSARTWRLHETQNTESGVHHTAQSAVLTHLLWLVVLCFSMSLYTESHSWAVKWGENDSLCLLSVCH